MNFTAIATIIFFIFLFIVTICLMFQIIYCFIMMRKYEKKGDALRKEIQKMIDDRKQYND